MERSEGTRARDSSVVRQWIRVAVVAVAVTAAACGSGEPEPERPVEPLRVLPPLARISERSDIRVEPARPGAFGADTTGPVWHRFNHRCSSCHALPSPGQHTARQWEAVVERMGENIDSAGLLPLSKEDREGITGFLRRHARREVADSITPERGR